MIFQVPVWFTYGCAALAAKDFKLAVKAFKRCVNIDYDVSLFLSSFREIHKLTPNLLNFLNGIIHLTFLELPTIILGISR